MAGKIIKNFIKHFGLYSISLSLPKIAGFIVLPFLTFYLSVEDFGHLNYFLLINTFAIIIVGSGLDTILIQKIKEFNEDFYSFLNICFQIFLTTTSLLITLLVFLYFFFPSLFGTIKSNLFFYFSINFLLAILYNLNQVINTFFQLNKNPLQIFKFQIILSITIIFFTIAFLKFFNIGWYSRIFGILLAFFLVFIIFVKKFKFKILFNHKNLTNFIKNYIGNSLLIVFSSLLTFYIFSFDKFFINKIFGIEIFGNYSFGNSLNQFLLFTFVSFNKVLTPIFIALLNDKKINQITTIMFFITLIIFLISFIFYFLVINYWTILFDSKFINFLSFYHYQILILITLQLGSMYSLILVIMNKNKVIFIINFIFTILIILLITFFNFFSVNQFLNSFFILTLFYLLVILFIVFINLFNLKNENHL